jgi:cell division protein ZapA
MKTTYLVTVLGREISVKSSAPTEKVKAIEAFTNNRLLKIGASLQTSDAQLVLTLALLNTAEELLELQAAMDSNNFLNDKLQEMISAIEKV